MTIETHRKHAQDPIGELHAYFAACPGSSETPVFLRFAESLADLSVLQSCSQVRHLLPQCGGNIWWIENEDINLARNSGQERLKHITTQHVKALILASTSVYVGTHLIRGSRALAGLTAVAVDIRS